MMTAGTPGGPVIEVFSLEVRWILPGPLDTAMARWLAGFPSEVESREDVYLLGPDMGGMSVKFRAGRTLDVKAFYGSPGTLNLRGRACGRMQYWRKWSVPFHSPGSVSGDPSGWKRVRKQRRTSRFSLARGWDTAPSAGRPGESRCAVELAEIHVHHQDWWSLGLEATGPADQLLAVLGAAAALVFTRPLPAGVDFRIQDSTSYAQWLCHPQCRP